MFKIGEFSRLTKVSVRMLRYYDEAGLLEPAAVDRFTGYRLYATAQIPTLQKILMLRDMGFGVAEIASMMDNWDAEAVTERLTAKRREVLDAIALEQKRVQKIDTAIQDLGRSEIAVHYNVTLKEIPSYCILSLRETIPDHFCESALWERLYAFVRAEKIEMLPGSSNLAIYHQEEEPDSGVDVEVGVLVKQPGQNKGCFIYRETEAVPSWRASWSTDPMKISVRRTMPLPIGWSNTSTMK